MRHRPNSPRAFTILEVVIALVFVSIALLALLRLQLGTIDLCRRAEMVTLATQVAQATIAEIQATGFPPLGHSSGSLERGGHQLDWQANVTGLGMNGSNAAAADSLRRIEIEVTWLKGADREALRLESAVANGSFR